MDFEATVDPADHDGISLNAYERSNVGGLFHGGGDVTIVDDVVIEGGALTANGQLTLAGTRHDVRGPVREPLPGDLPAGGVFSFLPD